MTEPTNEAIFQRLAERNYRKEQKRKLTEIRVSIGLRIRSMVGLANLLFAKFFVAREFGTALSAFVRILDALRDVGCDTASLREEMSDEELFPIAIQLFQAAGAADVRSILEEVAKHDSIDGLHSAVISAFEILQDTRLSDNPEQQLEAADTALSELLAFQQQLELEKPDAFTVPVAKSLTETTTGDMSYLLDDDFQFDGIPLTLSECGKQFQFTKQQLTQWATVKCVHLPENRLLRRRKTPNGYNYHYNDCLKIQAAKDDARELRSRPSAG